jgi:hypothetical protein
VCVQNSKPETLGSSAALAQALAKNASSDSHLPFY